MHEAYRGEAHSRVDADDFLLVSRLSHNRHGKTQSAAHRARVLREDRNNQQRTGHVCFGRIGTISSAQGTCASGGSEQEFMRNAIARFEQVHGAWHTRE
jgi:hypothetical protein